MRSASSAGEVRHADPRAETTHLRVLRRFCGTVLTVYWLTLFLATHVPIREGPGRIPHADKVMHFVGYGILGLLLTFWVALRRPLSASVLLKTVLFLAAYGALDELLQIPVGRSCELADWLSDLLGVSTGALLVASFSRLHPRLNLQTDRAAVVDGEHP